MELPFLELDYTASAKCRYQPHQSMDNQAPKKEHLMKAVYADLRAFESKPINIRSL
jgi:hypothetical protein